MSNTDNPFAALLNSDNTLEETTASSKEESDVNATIENTFSFTLNKDKKQQFTYLEDLSSALSCTQLNLNLLEHALFERLVLADASTRSDVSEHRVIVYLFNCFVKTQDSVCDEKLKSDFKNAIIRNVVISLTQPELFENQDLFVQLYDTFHQTGSNDFWEELYLKLLKDEDGLDSLKETFGKILRVIHNKVIKSTLVTISSAEFDVLGFYASHEELALLYLDFCKTVKPDSGLAYTNTLLGELLNISALPKYVEGEFQYFQDPLDQAGNATMENILWAKHNSLLHDVHKFMLGLLKCSAETKNRVLEWLGGCLRANADKGKLWNMQAPEFDLSNYTTASDGFMINLVAVMMKFCHPFCCDTTDGKILKVDPTYCAVDNEDCEKKGVHLIDMSKETCLIPFESEGESKRLTSPCYSFITEIFFIAHRAFDLGFRVTSDKLVRLNQNMARTERAYHEAVSQAGPLTDVADSIKQTMNTEITKFLSIKSTLSCPSLLDGVFDFVCASALWLTQVALNADYDEKSSNFTPLKLRMVEFPLSDKIPDTLKCIPEFIIGNIVCFLIFLRRFNPRTFEEQGYERLKPLLTCILVYMGSERTRNPHLRAHLAEALEALIPYHKDQPQSLNNISGVQRERLFKEHEYRREIVPILLDVFVGIEMTGQSVQFEQKFNYRRPMYMIMDYIWEIPEYQDYFKELAEDAERNIEAVSPPIFLRFINLLINDAIFLLDESLVNMAKLREMETARENGEWDNLSVNERSQNMGYMQHVGMIARFDNILGKDTIHTLECLTSHITIVFTHNTMVDRVAAMLNYFLLNLVGPNQKNFKVKDQKEYNFDPAGTVLNICKIYVNLKHSEAFCLAVSQDGRSYSPRLFTLAEDVLVRIGGGPLVGELQEVANKVSQKAKEQQSNEEVVAGAPDHFLDPIMSTLMIDPVILPSSKQTVDRSTIARHLLSDQTDPFNRAPLTMDQVIPNAELADEIKRWLDERRVTM